MPPITRFQPGCPCGCGETANCLKCSASDPFPMRQKCCSPCGIPRVDLTLGWSGPAGSGTVNLVYSNGQWSNTSCDHQLLYYLSCVTGKTKFAVRYFVSGGCPRGQALECASTDDPASLTLADYTCHPFHLHYQLTEDSCNALYANGITDFTIDGPADETDLGCDKCLSPCLGCPKGIATTLQIQDSNSTWDIPYNGTRWVRLVRGPGTVHGHTRTVNYEYDIVCNANGTITVQRFFSLAFDPTSQACVDAMDDYPNGLCEYSSEATFTPPADCSNFDLALVLGKSNWPFAGDPFGTGITIRSHSDKAQKCCSPCAIPKKNFTLTYNLTKVPSDWPGGVPTSGNVPIVANADFSLWQSDCFPPSASGFPKRYKWQLFCDSVTGIVSLQIITFAGGNCGGSQTGAKTWVLDSYTCSPYHLVYKLTSTTFSGTVYIDE